MIAQSVYARGRAEALRHKWIESERARRDLGKEAIQQWCRQYWNKYLRHRWVEHIRGVQYWTEVDRCDFGLLQRELLDEPILVDRILDRLLECHENLDVIEWARDWGIPMDRVLRVLEVLDINSRRLDDVLVYEGYVPE
jgi:hypothetical protein